MEVKGNVVLKKGKGDSLLRKHPWVFSGAVKYVLGSPEPGELVEVTDERGQFYGCGIFQHGSIIVRMLTFQREPVNTDFFRKRLQSAYRFRQQVGLDFQKWDTSVTNAWRLVFGEADSLSGIVIDIYQNIAVIQIHAGGHQHFFPELLDAFLELFSHNIQSIYLQVKSADENDGDLKRHIWGNEIPEVEIYEYDNKFIVDIVKGQKTGFFIDQRENRRMLYHYAYGKKILNLFSYTGGFTISALKGGAKCVVSVDSSSHAIQLCERNITLNGFDVNEHPCIVDDVYDFFEKNDELFDVIILDPPAFAKHLEAKHRAVKGYQRINLMALKALSPGGFLFTFSCSQIIDRKLFESTVYSSLLLSGRNAKVVADLSHAPCHAYSMHHPEGNYLKGLILYVE